jgi:hypothetical protein
MLHWENKEEPLTKPGLGMVTWSYPVCELSFRSEVADVKSSFSLAALTGPASENWSFLVSSHAKLVI